MARRFGAARELAAGPSVRARDEARAGLYVHVPFCARRCTYCDFSTGALSSAAVERYLEGMDRESAIRAEAASSIVFSSVFFGGGTPSMLSARHFRRLWGLISSRFRLAADPEITLEANPESVRPELVDAWVGAGVNRLSMGAQSFVPGELALLGRIHDRHRPGAAMSIARRYGFRRLSLDLMFGVPGHTMKSWRTTVETALTLAPEHLSAYCFIPEPGTELGDAVIGGSVELPGPEEQADLYAWCSERLFAAGYRCYETSNFCRPDGEARHNLVYWLVRPYVGLGPSAHGLIDGVRYGNHYALARWARALERGEAAEAEIERQTECSRSQEIMMLGLRLGEGLRAADYPRAAWTALVDRYGSAFESALGCGRLERTTEGVRIPATQRFLADDTMAWIEAEAERSTIDTSAGRFIPLIACPSLHSPAA